MPRSLRTCASRTLPPSLPAYPLKRCLPCLPSPPTRRAKIPEDVRLKGPAVVKATLEIYNTIRAQLLPTPAKSHYTYNMRDLSKVFQVRRGIGR